jgi:monoamine oxidase
MDRKHFLKQASILVPGLLLFPGFLAACKKKALFEGTEYKGRVVVVGAGAAGLYAAYLLYLQGADVIILEASDRIGGRIRTLKNFADFPIELGAEEIHGERSLLHDIALAGGAQFVENETRDFFYFNGSLKTEEQATENTFFNAMMDLIDSLPDYAGEDITAESWAMGINNNVIHIFNALIGNENGTSIDQLGMYGLLQQYQRWTAGEENKWLANTDMLSLFEKAFEPIIGKTVLNEPVTSIDYTGSSITILTSNATEYTADKVIVTIPLNMIKLPSITFNPPFSPERTTALNKIGMDRGMKIILKFDERVWPENTGSLFGDGLVPEFWATGVGRGTDNIITAFVTGQNASTLSALGENMIPTILAELDTLVGGASFHYVDHHIQNWTNKPYIRGAYSYALPGTGNAREVIAQPINNKVFFAGEATHNGGHHATVHGAMETGLRAVNEILENA